MQAAEEGCSTHEVVMGFRGLGHTRRATRFYGFGTQVKGVMCFRGVEPRPDALQVALVQVR